MPRTRPPTAGPMMPPSRKPPWNAAAARPRCSGAATRMQERQRRDGEHRRAEAADAAQDEQLGVGRRQPGERRRHGDDREAGGQGDPLAHAVDEPAGGQRAEQAHEREDADDGAGPERGDAELVGEDGDRRADDAEAERDAERHGREHRDLARQPGEPAAVAHACPGVAAGRGAVAQATRGSDGSAGSAGCGDVGIDVIAHVAPPRSSRRASSHWSCGASRHGVRARIRPVAAVMMGESVRLYGAQGPFSPLLAQAERRRPWRRLR